MKRFLCSAIIVLMCISNVNSQKFEQSLFRQLCNKLIEENKAFILRKELVGTELLTDPISGEQTIAYGPASKALDKFKCLSKQQQVDILSATDLPIFPLKDTFIIFDPNNFFTTGIHYKSEEVFFLTDDQANKKSQSKSFQLYQIGTRDNSLILSFPSSQSDEFYNFQFGLKAQDISVKLTRVDKARLKE
ncbi:hypothetical protein [Taibaiella koreensis]|uniref:hypothetical protein n=1 Tax=Taibaiella koreensis TaxID=1268548 RepID=UPI000E59A47A|nr:hypothetical protein [Taibaiella koreensis]